MFFPHLLPSEMITVQSIENKGVKSCLVKCGNPVEESPPAGPHHCIRNCEENTSFWGCSPAPEGGSSAEDTPVKVQSALASFVRTGFQNKMGLPLMSFFEMAVFSSCVLQMVVALKSK